MYQNFKYNDDGWLKEPADRHDNGQITKGCLWTILAWALAIVLFFASFTSCTTTRYVPIVQTRTDTCYITKHQRDSIYMKDSTHVSEQQKGDTVILKITEWHTKYVDRQVHDTTYIASHDTIPDPYPVEVKVEKQLSWWQKTRIHMGEAFILIALFAIAWWLFKKRAWWISLLRKVV